ncbi:MAG: hypothetical protein JST40_03870 [Armatimonadetes bacterium]|nr:hypothetical protein [Armatimonadota bacterium]
MADRQKLYFTFANHMHWVDMEWLWGYDVLPGSTRDMIAMCQATGAKGGVNFDAVGYEKMAVECPEALSELRTSIANGQIEVAGGSYGQPYGLFQGSESNCRQLIYGVRACQKQLGSAPTMFWEEEFYFFPQLPQLLNLAGYQAASLFFQWTWHTPHIPFETTPAVWWTAPDGTKILASTRNKLNLHQWPEDFEILLNQLAELGPQAVMESGVDSAGGAQPQRAEGDAGEGEASGRPPLIQQWVELMPSPDWMCRSELLIPQIKKLMDDPRFEVIPVLPSDFLAMVREDANIPSRSYSLKDVWHGMTLGKNGDQLRKRALETEQELLAAENLSVTASLMGRPYPRWDVYPSWELEEAWRQLLASQHHDNDECEGLCGDIGQTQQEMASRLARNLTKRLAEHWSVNLNSQVSINPLPWKVKTHHGNIPASGWREVVQSGDYINSKPFAIPPQFILTAKEDLSQIAPDWRPEGILAGQIEVLNNPPLDRSQPSLTLMDLQADSEVGVSYSSALDGDALAIEFSSGNRNLSERLNNPEPKCRIDPGLNSSVRLRIPIKPEVQGAEVDLPCQVAPLEIFPTMTRKYPEGDWMTSPQWFEESTNGFLSQTYIDLKFTENDGLLVIHHGHMQGFWSDNVLELVILTNDPWDEHFATMSLSSSILLLPYQNLSRVQKWKVAREANCRELRTSLYDRLVTKTNGKKFAGISVESDVAVPLAIYRESLDIDQNRPIIVRIVELEGTGGIATIEVPGPVEWAKKCDLLGNSLKELQVSSGSRSSIEVSLRPHEVATVYLDAVHARKQIRDLDAHRNIWATVHRVDD